MGPRRRLPYPGFGLLPAEEARFLFTSVSVGAGANPKGSRRGDGAVMQSQRVPRASIAVWPAVQRSQDQGPKARRCRAARRDRGPRQAVSQGRPQADQEERRKSSLGATGGALGGAGGLLPGSARGTSDGTP